MHDLCLCSSLTDFRESGHCSQDSTQEDSFVSGPAQFSETGMFCDSEIQGPATKPPEPADQPPNSALSHPELPGTSIEPPSCDGPNPAEACNGGLEAEPVEDVTGAEESSEPVQGAPAESSVGQTATCRSVSVLSKKSSSDSLSVSVTCMLLLLNRSRITS